MDRLGFDPLLPRPFGASARPRSAPGCVGGIAPPSCGGRARGGRLGLRASHPLTGGYHQDPHHHQHHHHLPVSHRPLPPLVSIPPSPHPTGHAPPLLLGPDDRRRQGITNEERKALELQIAALKKQNEDAELKAGSLRGAGRGKGRRGGGGTQHLVSSASNTSNAMTAVRIGVSTPVVRVLRARQSFSLQTTIECPPRP